MQLLFGLLSWFMAAMIYGSAVKFRRQILRAECHSTHFNRWNLTISLSIIQQTMRELPNLEFELSLPLDTCDYWNGEKCEGETRYYFRFVTNYRPMHTTELFLFSNGYTQKRKALIEIEKSEEKF
jgi:hypothetical protein